MTVDTYKQQCHTRFSSSANMVYQVYSLSIGEGPEGRTDDVDMHARYVHACNILGMYMHVVLDMVFQQAARAPCRMDLSDTVTVGDLVQA